MRVSPRKNDLLHPLTVFRHEQPLASVEFIEPAQMPEPYRTLLVHDGDMTSRLEHLYGDTLVLRCLSCEASPETYRREVVLTVEQSRLPVEYGAIEIQLQAFEGELRALIEEARLPLGGLLNRFGVHYRSRPRAFIRLGADSAMRSYFELPHAPCFYGRCNELLSADGVLLAQIVELLRP